MHFTRRRIALALGFSFLTLVVALPFIANTNAYPLAIVDGNSMYPTLHNGDLVFFAAPSASVQNGSIIVFVQTRSGVPAFDTLLQPVVIHRVIGVGREPNGVMDYQTKGDNNVAQDPFITDAPNVLGVPVVVVPFAGFPILFGKSAYGMVTITALVSLYFFAGVDTKLEEADERKRLIAVFARHSLNGEISPGQFERLKLAVEYFDDMPIELIRDPTILATVDWLKAGGLANRWTEESQKCERCGSRSFVVSDGEHVLAVCPICIEDWQNTK